MSAERFEISSVNPNDSCGGGGCACSDTKVPESDGPFVVFYSAETTSSISPHVVVCASCIRAASDRLDNGDVLAAGEVDGEVVEEIVDDDVVKVTNVRPVDHVPEV